MKIVMIAAENDALPGAKVGGIADVVRDLPRALAAKGHEVDVVVPSYGVLHELPGAVLRGQLDVNFRGDKLGVALWEIVEQVAGDDDTRSEPRSTGTVRQWVLHSAAFAPVKAGQIYCNDPPHRPFASDANKFALFCAAACEATMRGAFGVPDVIHLHDWHAALVLLLRAFDPRYAAMQRVRCVYTIHNLALQGVRPLRGDPSSLASWFPTLRAPPDLIADPRWKDCINPVALAIRLADSINTVSPSYAQDIVRPNDVQGAGFHGGEGLEADLQKADGDGRLHGVLNGCEYPDPDIKSKAASKRSWPRLLERLRAEVLVLAGRDEALASVHWIALRRLDALGRKRPSMLITSIGRLVDQKLGLLQERLVDVAPGGRGVDPQRTVLDAMLEALGDDGVFVLLGNGDPQLESTLRAVSSRHENFVFVCGYAHKLSQSLYRNGDLFLMPSSYEPCGISQMLAMRAGQPCLVHHVGGLRDTVEHGVTGFGFSGATRSAQAAALLRTFNEVLDLHRSDSARWKQIGKAAAAARFDWADSAEAYLRDVYSEASQ